MMGTDWGEEFGNQVVQKFSLRTIPDGFGLVYCLGREIVQWWHGIGSLHFDNIQFG